MTVVWEVKGKEPQLKIGDGGGANADQLQGRYGDPKHPKLTASVSKTGENSFTFEVE